MNKFSLSHYFLKSLILTSVFCFIFIGDAEAKPQTQLVNNITVNMYVLVSSGAMAVPLQPCNTNDITRRSYGCTFFPGDATRQYPFTSNTPTIGIENHMLNGVQQGYLHNVTPEEAAITVSSQGNKPFSCVKAQAIAARTFAYYHINAGSTIDNSINKQVYIPYYYYSLTTAQQQRVNEAVSEVFYMTAAGSTNPIRAHFGVDNDAWTQNGGESYLVSVYDPISTDYGQDIGTDNGGMSSRGCSRWGFGHTSSRGPVASDDPLYPHDNQGYGDFWNGQWDESFQILTHYYTGIHIRNAGNTILTPEYRWNPLEVRWANPTLPTVPPPMTPNGFYSVNMMFQNTGSINWSARLAYQWRDADGMTIRSGSGVSWSLSKGGASPTIINAIQVYAPATPGVYTLIIDMQVNNGGIYESFFDREPGRPWYPLVYTCEVGGGECILGGEIWGGGDIFLPIILKNA